MDEMVTCEPFHLYNYVTDPLLESSFIIAVENIHFIKSSSKFVTAQAGEHKELNSWLKIL